MEPHQPDAETAAALRRLPSVDHVLNQPAVANLLEDYPRSEVTRVVRELLEACRTRLRGGERPTVDVPQLALQIRERLYERNRPSLRRVINATGIVLHTGLGRAPLPEEALEAINEVATGYCSLELDLETGQRGSRHDHARALLCELTGAEDALVVNNNAAATYLALNTFAAEHEAIVSRGQLVEIGGSYRMPDIMAAARCRMVEVGTTNRTRIADYERAISDQTRILVHVHTSNYRVVGFTESTPLAELVALARRHNLLVVDDLGSGLLTPDLAWSAPPEEAPDDETFDPAPGPAEWDEPNVRASVADGADLTLFSGDKLLGGPQAGILIGRKALIADLRRNPLTRTFRPDKLTLAALEATLRLYRDPQTVVQRVPVHRLLARQPDELSAMASRLGEQIAAALPEAEVFTELDDSEAGGGSLAAIPFPTCTVTVRIPDRSAAAIASALRQQDVPIICRIHDEHLVFDPRTLSPDEAERIPGALVEAVREAE